MEDFSSIEKYLIQDLTEEKKDKKFRRYMFTWNNPFWENQFEEIDIDNTDLKLNLDKYDLYYFKKFENIELFDFRTIKYVNRKTKEEEVVIRPFFKDDNAIKQYIENLTNLKYSVFQIEKGGNSELIHIQGLIIFDKPFNWSTFCRCFPLADFADVYSSNTHARAYCMKEDTRIRGPYELGEFIEERKSSKTKEFMHLIELGATNSQLREYDANLYVMNINKIDKLRADILFEPFMKKRRNVVVTYIYGPSRSGKTTYVVDKYGLGNFYNVDTYSKGPFDNYAGQDIIIFDEYASQINVTLFNKLIDSWPVQLPCRFANKWACYTQIYIVSNLPLAKQYNKEDIEPEVRNAFVSRIHQVIRFEKGGIWYYEKKLKDSEQLSVENLLIPVNEDLDF